MENKQESVGINPETFNLVLHENFEKYKYIVGCDPYEEEKPINIYNKIKKFLGLSYKVKESNSYVAIYKVGSDGSIEHLNRKQ